MSWRHWIDHGMEAQFNPRVAVGAETESWLQSWEDDAARRKAELAGAFDIAYGAHQLMRFDYMPAQAGLPVIINIHGGYWRALDKSIMMHHMADLAASGFGIVNVNYPLCPEVSLTEIMAALNGGLTDIIAHCDRHTESQRYVLKGHSAGAHMAMHLSHHPALAGRLPAVVALSGIYETGLVRELPVNDDVRLSVAEAERWDCLQNMPVSGPAYYISAGGAEPSGWIDQSWEMANALSRRGDKVTFHICSGAHHFSLVDRLCDRHNPEGAKLHRWIADH